MRAWKEREAKDWKCNDYVDFIKDTGIDSFYYKFYNVGVEGTGGFGLSYGFRCPSLDLSRTWAVENKFLLHRCKIHNGEKHSVLQEERDFPTATWICPSYPKVTGLTQIPERYDYSKGNYIPYTFGLLDKPKGLALIWKMARKARIWHFETTVFANKFRESSIFPDKILDKWGDSGRAEKLERVMGSSLRIEFDTTKEKNKENSNSEINKYRRRDFMQDGDNIVSNAQKIIDFMNGEMYSRFGFEKESFEWYFSGNGLYLVTRRGLYCEDVRLKNNTWKEWSRQKFYNFIWNYWNDYTKYLDKKIRNEGIMYINVDYKTQFLRSYIKSPFSLHRTYDRLTLPLTSMFKGNNQIDLNLGWWRKYIEPKNITKEFVEKTEMIVND